MTQTQPKPDMELRVLTVRELAGYLRIHQALSTACRFNREEIDRWMIHERKRG